MIEEEGARQKTAERVPLSPGFSFIEPNDGRCEQSRHALVMAMHGDFL
jgi:hypothetical protein